MLLHERPPHAPPPAPPALLGTDSVSEVSECYMLANSGMGRIHYRSCVSEDIPATFPSDLGDSERETETPPSVNVDRHFAELGLRRTAQVSTRCATPDRGSRPLTPLTLDSPRATMVLSRGSSRGSSRGASRGSSRGTSRGASRVFPGEPPLAPSRVPAPLKLDRPAPPSHVFRKWHDPVVCVAEILEAVSAANSSCGDTRTAADLPRIRSSVTALLRALADATPMQPAEMLLALQRLQEQTVFTAETAPGLVAGAVLWAAARNGAESVGALQAALMKHTQWSDSDIEAALKAAGRVAAEPDWSDAESVALQGRLAALARWHQRNHVDVKCGRIRRVTPVIPASFRTVSFFPQAPQQPPTRRSSASRSYDAVCFS